MPTRVRTFVDLDGDPHYSDPEAEPRDVTWTAVLADPDGGVGATYHPRIWVKTQPTYWSRMELFSSGNLTIRIYVKDGAASWRFGSYSGSYPSAPVPMKIFVAE